MNTGLILHMNEISFILRFISLIRIQIVIFTFCVDG